MTRFVSSASFSNAAETTKKVSLHLFSWSCRFGVSANNLNFVASLISSSHPGSNTSPSPICSKEKCKSEQISIRISTIGGAPLAECEIVIACVSICLNINAVIRASSTWPSSAIRKINSLNLSLRFTISSDSYFRFRFCLLSNCSNLHFWFSSNNLKVVQKCRFERFESGTRLLFDTWL